MGRQKGFETSEHALTILGADDEVVAQVSGSKREVADAVWDAVRRSREGTNVGRHAVEG